MDIYALVVFTHVASVVLFFMLHGASMMVAFRVGRERDPDRLRALLDVSRTALGVPAIVLVLVGLATGVLAGFMRGWWGELWIWISLVLFVGVGFAMTPTMANPMNAMRVAAGQPNARRPDEAVTENLEELRRLQAAWNPVPMAVAGIGALVLILYLMLVKPF